LSDSSVVLTDNSDRAAIAMLTLQVRAARAETELAERQLAMAEQAARVELRERLDALQEERRQILLGTLDRARAEATASIEAARTECGLSDEVDTSIPEVVGEPQQPIERTLLVHRSTSAVGQVSTSVTVDLDTLARVCAMVVTEVLEQRYGAGAASATMTVPYAVPVGYLPAASAPQPTKKGGFFRNLLHADILLIMAAAAIVAVVLVAWLG
jgi:hypothetical protein